MAFKMSNEPQTIKIFNLRSDTNEFIGAGDAYIPPHTGLPANCTDIAPPDIPASHIAVFDAETETWSLHEDHRGETVYDTTTGNQVYISELGPLPENTTTQAPASPVDKFENGKWVADLNTALTQKHAEINDWRNIQENMNYVFRFNNHNWDYGKTTQERLSLSVQMAKANKLPAGFIWTDADNNDVPMSAGELLNLSDAIDQAMFTMGLQIHLRQREMKEEVDKLTDAQAVLDYVVGWPASSTPEAASDSH
ncbi:phage tail protein [Salmonella enterica subsp. enterica]|nr:phage tail protein [Salmonella enterica subsp. enterica serovar Veneziana]